MFDLISYNKRWVGGGILLLLAVGFLGFMEWRIQKMTATLLQQISSPMVGITLNQKLALTEIQKNQIQSLEKKYESELRVCCERHCSSRMKIGELFQSGQVDHAALTQFTREVCDAYAEGEEATMQHIVAICSILYPQQKAIFLKQVATQIAAGCL